MHTSMPTAHHPLFPEKHFQDWDAPVVSVLSLLFQCPVLGGFTGPEWHSQWQWHSHLHPNQHQDHLQCQQERWDACGNQTPQSPDFHLLNDGFISINDNLLRTDTEKKKWGAAKKTTLKPTRPEGTRIWLLWFMGLFPACRACLMVMRYGDMRYHSNLQETPKDRGNQKNLTRVNKNGRKTWKKVEIHSCSPLLWTLFPTVTPCSMAVM